MSTSALTLTASKMRFVVQMTGLLMIGGWLFVHPEASVALALVALTGQYTLTSKAGEVLLSKVKPASPPPAAP